MNIQKYTSQETQNIGLGQTGSIFVTGTAEVECLGGIFIAITFLEDTVFTSLVAETTQGYPDITGTGTLISASNGDNVATETFPKGVTIYGRWTKFTLASGLVVAYRG